MSDATWVQGDTGPDMTSTLMAGDVVFDLSDVTTLRFQMRKDNDKRYTVNAVAEVVNAATGRVRYQWQPNDLTIPGDYLVQWEMTFVDGMIQTTEPPNTITVRRQ